MCLLISQLSRLRAFLAYPNKPTSYDQGFSHPMKYVMEILVDSLLKTLAQHWLYSAESAMQILIISLFLEIAVGNHQNTWLNKYPLK